MSTLSINHLGIAVPSLAQAIQQYQALHGIFISAPHEVPQQKVRVAFLDLASTRLELLEPTAPESPIARFLQKNPRGGLHHVCYDVLDIHAKYKELIDGGFQLLDTPKPGAEGYLVFFVHPQACHGVLTEFQQKPKVI